MESRPTREVAIPARALPEIRRSLREEVGPLASIHGLHAAGYAAGEELYAIFSRGYEEDIHQMEGEAFWGALSRFFRSRGWGSFSHETAHPGVGLLHSEDWAEAEPDSEGQPSCAFTAGLLSHFLTLAAGGPIAVLEVSCVSGGASRCTFAFGSEGAIHELYGHLLEGTSVDDALARV